MAENHPVGFQWVVEARERGAKVIHVDPSAMADMWVPLRAGSDIAFLGGLIRYVIENGKDFREYVLNYTNASVILRDDFRDTEDLGGVFSGWDEQKKEYKMDTWAYAGAAEKGSTGGSAGGGHAKDRGGEQIDEATYEQDLTLQNPRCVYQLLKRHFSRYTPRMVEEVCGVPEKLFLEVAEAFCSASGPDKTAAICYAVGWTQHFPAGRLQRLRLLRGGVLVRRGGAQPGRRAGV